jgi:hypothetical protein
MRIPTFVTLLLVASAAHTQALQFHDTNSPPEAVGMFYATRAISTTLLAECSARVPGDAVQWSQQLQTWLTAESQYLEKTDQYYRREAPKLQSLRNVDAQVESVIKPGLELIATSPDGAKKVDSFCRTHFEALSNGTFLARTPTAHKDVQALPWLEPQVSPQFIGVWANVVAGYENWWVLEPHSVVNYGTALGGGRCTGSSAAVLTLDRIEVKFGNAAVVSLRKSNGMLLLTAPGGVAAHKRVPKADICRKSNGEYYEGAPYAGG